MDSLTGIVAFVRSAESLSFAGAARTLGVSSSAVGKSIARLESAMGVRLFQRSTRKVRLTPEGLLFFERCRRILDDLQDAEAEMAHATQAPRGRLRVSLPAIGYRFLLPHLKEFRRLHPEISLDLDFNDQLVDLIEEGVDVAIRSGTLPDSRLMARRLGPFRFVLCASTAYLQAHGVPQAAEDLQRHECIRYRFVTTGKLMAWGIASGAPLRLRDGLVCNNMEAVLAAVLDGHGLAYMPDFLIREAMRDGRLQSVLDECVTDHGQFWAVWSSGRTLLPRVRVFVDYIATRLFPVDGGSSTATRKSSGRKRR
ncbi:LysR family transcriptional regulator [Dyella japonica]|uniref:LysR family transcriptional regulator n=1 Tax=Dyella japonica A8 TaxID=1217721 RepID=A0A075K0R2_9GAMM|nr:LysR family transcriptional regulator [Dyella japonica]AIF47352.1 LysR family transcriptional regulator [Dyella japonica A8]